MNPANNFGALSNEYGQARKGYSQEVYDYLKILTPSHAHVLDVGCGSGIY